MIICKLHRQHTSVVMTVPKLVCKDLGLCAGDYVVLFKVDGWPEYLLQKFKTKDISNGRGKEHSDRKDSGG